MINDLSGYCSPLVTEMRYLGVYCPLEVYKMYVVLLRQQPDILSPRTFTPD